MISSRPLLALACVSVAGSASAGLSKSVQDPRDFRVEARGFLTDDGHPRRPGDVRRYEIDARIVARADLAEVRLEFDSGEGEERSTDRYFVRRGRIFQIDDEGKEKDAEPLGDLTVPALAALHPWIVENAMRERPENVTMLSEGRRFFAWNDVLWTITQDPASGQILQLARPTWNDVFGDGEEIVRFEHKDDTGEQGETASASLGEATLNGVVVLGSKRELARFEFGAPTAIPPSPLAATQADSTTVAAFPEGERSRDHARRIGSSEITFTELAPHLFAIDLASMNTRIVIAEFEDHVIVLEGAYNSANVDLVVEAVRERFHKPPRYFAFSHLHGQYLGGVRSWVAAGATILVPPSTAPLVEEVAAARFALHPDALARSPRPPQIEPVPVVWRHEDRINAIDVHNTPDSDHTDEYFLFYFPRSKILMTGDLLFLRPGKPLTGRSKKLCETVRTLGLDVERYVATWPLSGYDTKNIVTREEMAKGCE